MKTAAKIIAYCIWFSVVLFLSVYHYWLLEIVLKIWHAGGAWEFSGTILFWVSLSILWLGFICLLSWLPIWLMKKRGFGSARLIAKVATFLMMLLVCFILSGIVWQILLPEKVYNCTDDNFFGFLRPGDWIHGAYVTVPKIDPSDSMSKPDSIKEGWSVAKLWCVWLLFIFASVAASASVTFLIFRSRTSKSDQAMQAPPGQPVDVTLSQ
jgi:hypothetical protein